MVQWILGLFPYEEHSKQGDFSKASLVICDKWITLPFQIPRTWTTYISGNNLKWGEVSVCRYWGKELRADVFDDEKYNFKIIRLPWHTQAYKRGTLINGEWVEHERLYEVTARMEKIADRKQYTFQAYGKEITATVWGACCYDSYSILPKWLKPLFKKQRAWMEVEFSDEIGSNRGSWKGGTIGLNAEFIKDLDTSWNKFATEELPRRINE